MAAPVTVSIENVTIDKTLDSEEFQTPAIVFDIRNDREAAIHIRLTDPIPDSIPLDAIGFHPDYGAEHWTIDGREAIFERTFDPDETYTTLYGLRADDPEEATVLMDEPGVKLIDPETQGLIAANTDADVIDSESEQPQSPSEPDRETHPTDADATADQSSRSSPEDQPGSGTDSTAVSSSAIVARLSEELREGTVAEPDREVIQEHLTQPPGSIEARLDSLQARMTALHAAEDDLDAFLNADGTGQQAIRSLRDTIADLHTTLSDLEEVMEDTDERTDALESALESLTGDLEEIEANLDRIERLPDRLATIETELETVREEVKEVHTFRERFASAVTQSDE